MMLSSRVVIWIVGLTDSFLLVQSLKLSAFPPLNLRKGLLSRLEEATTNGGDKLERSFADISIEGGILDWPPCDLKLDESRQVQIIKGDYGYDYICSLPIPGKKLVDDKPQHSLLGFDDETRKQQLYDRLLPLDGTCFYLKINYWTYEVCPFRQIRQFHIESKRTSVVERVFEVNSPSALGSIIGDVVQSVFWNRDASGMETITDEILLGRYGGGLADPQAILKTHNHIRNGHLIQTYDDGDICSPEINIPRKVELKWECSHSRPFEHILDVTELSSCHYWIRIGSPRVCLPDAMTALRTDIVCARAPNSSFQSRKISSFSSHASTNSTDANTTNTANGPTSKVRGINFWRERLLRFLMEEQQEFPHLHKAVYDFMDAEHMEMPKTDEEVPEELLRKWMAILGFDFEKLKHDSASSGDANKRNDINATPSNNGYSHLDSTTTTTTTTGKSTSDNYSTSKDEQTDQKDQKKSSIVSFEFHLDL